MYCLSIKNQDFTFRLAEVCTLSAPRTDTLAQLIRGCKSAGAFSDIGPGAPDQQIYVQLRRA